MSTYFYFRDEISRTELEKCGVLFHDGEMETKDGTKPYTWIVDRLPVDGIKVNYLHPNFRNNGNIIGFTRYGANSSEFLCDILSDNLIDFVDEYTVADVNVPVDYVAELLDIDISDDASEECLNDIIIEEFCYAPEMFFSSNPKEVIREWVEEDKVLILERFKSELSEYQN